MLNPVALWTFFIFQSGSLIFQEVRMSGGVNDNLCIDWKAKGKFEKISEQPGRYRFI